MIGWCFSKASTDLLSCSCVLVLNLMCVSVHVRLSVSVCLSVHLCVSYLFSFARCVRRVCAHAAVNIARVVPNGMLVFFPSYPVMAECIEHWKVRILMMPGSRIHRMLLSVNRMFARWGLSEF